MRSRTRNTQVCIRLTPKEKQLLKALAHHHKMTQTSLISRLLIQEYKRLAGKKASK